MSRGTCHVANQHCACPAGWCVQGVGVANNDETVATRCYHCDQHVCTDEGCSTLTTKFVKGKRVRVCQDCAENEGNEELMRDFDAAIYLGSGYPEIAAKIRAGEAKAQWREG